MDNLVVIQLLGIINPEIDQLEMSESDIKYLNDPVVQIAIRKIKLLCFKYAIDNKLDSAKFKYELGLILLEFENEEKEYLDVYANDMIIKMKEVIEPVESKGYKDEFGWHWGDEVSPKR